MTGMKVEGDDIFWGRQEKKKKKDVHGSSSTNYFNHFVRGWLLSRTNG